MRGRAYADSALALSKKQADDSPGDIELQVLYGLMLGYLKKPAEARAAVARALAIKPNPADARRTRAYAVLNAARVELALGDTDKALTYLEQLFAEGYGRTGDFLAHGPDVPVTEGQSEV